MTLYKNLLLYPLHSFSSFHLIYFWICTLQLSKNVDETEWRTFPTIVYVWQITYRDGI